ncbi:MAG: gliding motility-associated C-terminal domain-containing protein [Salibacteraceae bacterium]
MKLTKLPTYITCLLVFVSSLALGQDVPELRCISLDDNDNVTLNWQQPADTGADFNQYIIRYRQGTAGNFNVISQVTDYNQTSALLTGPFTVPGSFYIQQVYNGFADTSGASETASPILVGLTSNGKVLSLGWNPTGLPGTDSLYSLLKQNDTGSFELIKKLDFPLTAFDDTIKNCSENVAFRVEVKGNGGCISRSNTIEGLVVDNVPPARTNLYVLNVDTATGLVDLEWQRSASADVLGYMIFYFEDFVRADTVFGADSLQYRYEEFGIDARLQAETLSVAPFDSCFDSVLSWYNQAADSLRFQTMFIDSSDFDRCSGSLTIEWELPVDGFPVGVRNLSGFRVYRKILGEGSTLIATLPAEDSLFVDSGLVSGKNYTYVVNPFDEVNDKEAMSNKLEISLDDKNEPDFLYISSILNNHESGENEVNVYADTTAETVKYGMFRSISNKTELIQISEHGEDLSAEMVFVDESGQAGQTDYFYQVVAFDVCGDPIGNSQIAKSIHIQGEKQIRDLLNHLSWTGYEGFDSAGTSVDIYDLYRVYNNGLEDLIYSSLTPLRFTDDLVELTNISGDICYYIAAAESPGNIYGFNEVAQSNLVCLNYPAKVFIPNAFTPDDDGFNDLFLPNVNYINPDSYVLSIYDRMGNLIYQTKDPLKGWDGANHPNGVYAYHLFLTNALDDELQYSGKIHLIR